MRKKSFEPKVFQLPSLQNITKHNWAIQLSINMESSKIWDNFWTQSKYSWHSRIWIYGGLLTLYLLIVTHGFLMLYVAISYTLLQMSSYWCIIDTLPVLASYVGTSREARFSAAWITVFRIADFAPPSFSQR